MALKSTREAAMLAIQELAREDDKIVIVSPDSVAAARATKFREEFPDRVIEVGIAEQDAVVFHSIDNKSRMCVLRESGNEVG